MQLQLNVVPVFDTLVPPIHGELDAIVLPAAASAGVYEIVEQTKKELFKSTGVDVTIAKASARKAFAKLKTPPFRTRVTDFQGRIPSSALLHRRKPPAGQVSQRYVQLRSRTYYT